MLLERYYDESLAQASYLIGCERAREAIVIDPNRDVEAYVRAAAARRVQIRYVTETHIHADFLSGARELAETTGATLLLSSHGGADWSYRYPAEEQPRLVSGGDTIDVGSVRLSARHTPGHTPEHLALLVTDTATGERPIGLVSGDFLFVGDVGRPDLLERAANMAGTMERAARALYASLRDLRELPDYLQVWPGHGAGSACGKALGSVPQTTLGYERLYNPAFQQPDEATFVRWVLEDQPEPPPYFARMKQLNRDGPPPRRRGPLRALDVTALANVRREPHWLVDVRGSSEFAREHLAGAVNIPASSKFVTYAGTVLSYDRPIVLIARSAEHALAVARQLTLIGLDSVAGWLSADGLREAGEAVATLRTVEAGELANSMTSNGPRIIDVRGRTEWNGGHLPRATHMYLGDLVARADELPRDASLVLACESGTRSSIAASLLMSRGFTDVANLVGGFEAWKKAGLPVSTEP